MALPRARLRPGAQDRRQARAKVWFFWSRTRRPVRAFASRALRLRGYTVLEAESAEEALKALEDPNLTVDVFVTDVVMPGMDGPSWVKRALEDRPNVKVIFVSGYAEDALSETQARIPNSVFLPKPFSLNDLTATVQGQMH